MIRRSVSTRGSMSLLEDEDYHWDGDTLHLHMDAPIPIKIKKHWWEFWYWFHPGKIIVSDQIVVKIENGIDEQHLLNYQPTVYDGYASTT